MLHSISAETSMVVTVFQLKHQWS